MARKTKEIINDEEIFEKVASKTTRKANKTDEKETKMETKPKKISVSKKKAEQKKSAKKATALDKSKSTTKKTKSETTKSDESKKSTLSVEKAKSSKLKSSAKPKVAKSSSSRPSSKKATKKSTTTKAKSIKKESKRKLTVFTPEYYDLPYRYNQTVVKILAQTPSSLFIYWDISDEDRNRLKETYGDYIFETTKPVLIIHNLTMNYSFEVDINDFANSWYLHINDSKCEYNIELGRRPIPINYSYISNYAEDSEPIKPVEVPYIYISSSNRIEAPNDKILFNKEQNMIYFRNVKTNDVIAKDTSSLVFISNIGRFYNISELYNKFFREDEIIRNDYILNNPSSGNPSSGYSSKFK